MSVRYANVMVEEVYDDMLTIGGKNYCAPHRLEICGECGYNFRMGNILHELDWNPASQDAQSVYARAEKMDADAASENGPPRLAPGTAESPDTKALRSKQLPPANLDPSSMRAWDHDGSWPVLEATFLLSFSRAEIGLMGQGRHKGDTEFELRQTLHAIARACDSARADPAQLRNMEEAHIAGNRRHGIAPPEPRARRPNAAPIPIPSFTIQDEAQSEAIMLHVTRAVETDIPFPGQAGIYQPLLEVRYTYNTVAGLGPSVLDSISAGMRLLPAGALQQGIGASVAEIRLLHKMLQANTARLAPAYVARAARRLPPGWHVSVVMPVLKRTRSEEPAVCSVCGGPGKKTCSRCKRQTYCSAACQKDHWPIHKATCRKPDAAKGGSLAVVNLREAEASAQEDESMARMQGLKLHSTSLHSAMSASRMAMSNFDGAGSGEMRDKMTIFKLQLPMAPTDVNSANMTAADAVEEQLKEQAALTGRPMPSANLVQAAFQDPRGEGIMAYDQRRRLQFKIYPSACAQHAQLVSAIRQHGVRGLKAYFNAYVTPERELRIDMSEMLPPQAW